MGKKRRKTSTKPAKKQRGLLMHFFALTVILAALIIPTQIAMDKVNAQTHEQRP